MTQGNLPESMQIGNKRKSFGGWFIKQTMKRAENQIQYRYQCYIVDYIYYIFLLCYDLMLNCLSYIRRRRFIFIYRINIAVFDYNLSIIIYSITVLSSFNLFLL